MPRLTDVVFATRTIKKFNNYHPNPIKYKIVMPPILKNTVSSKSDLPNKAACIEELSLMLACLKKEDFHPTSCQKEITSYNTCIIDFKKDYADLQEARRTGLVKKVDNTKGSTATKTVKARPTAKVVNTVLKRFPQPPTDIKINV